MKANGGTRKRADEVLAALIGGMSLRKTAATLGVSTSTVERISAENRSLIEAARAEQGRRVAETLKGRAMYAAERLEDMLDSPNDAVVISAIRTALAEAARWTEVADFAERLSALEARAGLRAVRQRGGAA